MVVGRRRAAPEPRARRGHGRHPRRGGHPGAALPRRPCPTPLVGFAVKRLGAAAGVVVTASHNPPEYNGYKVYWENAAQIVPPIDARIAAAIERAPAGRESCRRPPLDELRARGLVTDAPPDIERAYLDAVACAAVHPGGGDRALAHRLHAAARRGRRARCAARSPRAASRRHERPRAAEARRRLPHRRVPEPRGEGRDGPRPSPSRRRPARSSSSPTIPTPTASRSPCPRATAAGSSPATRWACCSGTTCSPRSRRPRPRAVLASIVSSPLLGRIAARLGVRYEETLTGFKWIANRAMELEREGCQFVFGYEEALGLLRRATSCATRTASRRRCSPPRWRRSCASAGETLQDELDAIARALGRLHELAGQRHPQGRQRRGRDPRDDGRACARSPPRRVGDDEVVAVADYEARTRTDRAPAPSAPLTPSAQQRPRLRARVGQPHHRAPERHRAQGQVLLRRPRGGPSAGRGRRRRRGPGHRRQKTPRRPPSRPSWHVSHDPGPA